MSRRVSHCLSLVKLKDCWAFSAQGYFLLWCKCLPCFVAILGCLLIWVQRWYGTLMILCLSEKAMDVFWLPFALILLVLWSWCVMISSCTCWALFVLILHYWAISKNNVRFIFLDAFFSSCCFYSSGCFFLLINAIVNLVGIAMATGNCFLMSGYYY